jgi:CO/xanthine dehydrogenase FAD-binding subunit
MRSAPFRHYAPATAEQSVALPAPLAPVAAIGAEPHPRRVDQAAEALAGEAPGPAALAAVAVQPMEVAQNTTQDRRALVRTVTRQALEQAA